MTGKSRLSTPSHLRIWCARRQTGITLIQVFVIFAVLGVLLIFLEQYMSSRRSAAKGAAFKCQYHLKLIAEATASYSADDPMANALPVAPSFAKELGGAFEYGGKSGLEDYPASQAMESEWGSGANRGESDRPLNPYLFNIPALAIPAGSTPQQAAAWKAKYLLVRFQCPWDSGDTTSGWENSPPGFKTSRTMGTDRFRKSGRSAYDYYGTSYAANTLWCYYEKDGSPVALPGNGESPIYSLSPFLHSTTAVPNPHRTILYNEANARYAARWAGNYPCPVSYYGNKGKIKGWHGRDWFFNAAFADGHAGLVEMDGSEDPSTITTPFTPVTTNGISTNAKDWQCMLFRGNGWQLDILPSAPAMTHHTTADSSKSEP